MISPLLSPRFAFQFFGIKYLILVGPVHYYFVIHWFGLPFIFDCSTCLSIAGNNPGLVLLYMTILFQIEVQQGNSYHRLLWKQVEVDDEVKEVEKNSSEEVNNVKKWHNFLRNQKDMV